MPGAFDLFRGAHRKRMAILKIVNEGNSESAQRVQAS